MENLLTIAGLLISGGIFGKLLDTLFLSKKDKVDANSQIIKGLQELVLQNIGRQNDMQKDMDYWRKENNELHKENQNIIAENENLRKTVESLTRKYDDLKRKYDQLIKQRD